MKRRPAEANLAAASPLLELSNRFAVLSEELLNDLVSLTCFLLADLLDSAILQPPITKELPADDDVPHGGWISEPS